ncbi:hypothetical protein, partial [Streptomyces yangpuensis]|uniref:hypothetical protein n=1 Tax=Streptomyces yangpuensis TaxID=1648182 RepID=UPI0035D5CC46
PAEGAPGRCAPRRPFGLRPAPGARPGPPPRRFAQVVVAWAYGWPSRCALLRGGGTAAADARATAGRAGAAQAF